MGYINIIGGGVNRRTSPKISFGRNICLSLAANIITTAAQSILVAVHLLIAAGETEPAAKILDGLQVLNAEAVVLDERSKK